MVQTQPCGMEISYAIGYFDMPFAAPALFCSRFWIISAISVNKIIFLFTATIHESLAALMVAGLPVRAPTPGGYFDNEKRRVSHPSPEKTKKAH